MKTSQILISNEHSKYRQNRNHRHTNNSLNSPFPKSFLKKTQNDENRRNADLAVRVNKIKHVVCMCVRSSPEKNIPYAGEYVTAHFNGKQICANA